MDFTNREEVGNKLKELKEKNLPHMTIEQFAKLDSNFAKDIEKATNEERKDIEERLYPFYRVEEGDNICAFTDKLPCLRWGLTHGVAIDERSGFEWVCKHRFTINGENKYYERILQYHPDNYSLADEEENTESVY